MDFGEMICKQMAHAVCDWYGEGNVDFTERTGGLEFVRVRTETGVYGVAKCYLTVVNVTLHVAQGAARFRLVAGADRNATMRVESGNVDDWSKIADDFAIAPTLRDMLQDIVKQPARA